MDNYGTSAGAASSFGPPAHYNGILFGDMTATQADCEGALAVGGTAKFGSAGHGYDIGAGGVAGWDSIMIGRYENPNGYPTLLLGGAIMNESTSVRVYTGDVVLKSSYKQEYESKSFAFETGAIRYEEDQAVDEFFSTTKALTIQANATLSNGNSKKIALRDLSNLKSLNHSEYIGNNLCTDKRVLVYTIDCGEEDSISIGEIGLGGYIADYDMIVVNAAAKEVTFAGGTILYDGAIINTSLPRIYEGNALIALVASKLIFNFPNATEVKAINYGVIGSILAPAAAVTAGGGSINGMLIADSLYQAGGMELHAFTISQGEGVWNFGCDAPTGSVAIQKLDDDEKGLEGAEFSLFAYDETTGSYALVGFGGTDQVGELHFDGLQIGLYKLVETKPPLGYNPPDEREWIFELTVNDEGEVQQLGIIYIKNTVAKSSVTVNKLDFDDREIKLADALFSLYRYNDESGDYDDLMGENLTTDENGVLTIDDLPPGKYKLMETEAPEGYYLPADAGTEFQVELDEQGRIIEGEPIFITNKQLGKIQFYKIDSENEALFLEGAAFALYKKNSGGEYLVARTGLVSGADGGLLIEGLEPGEYKLLETKAPYGYLLPDDPEVEFTIEL